MKLVVVLTAVAAVCGAAKLDRNYLPPASARTAGGSPGALQTPLGEARGSYPKGSFTNDFQGVVVDAVAAGTRSSDPTDTGLGAPRLSYGSQDSKVGSAAFKLANHGIHEDSEEFVPGSADAFRTNTRFNAQNSGIADGHASATSFVGHGFASQQSNGQDRAQAARDRSANTLRFESEVGPESFNYAFETDNGIAAEESGVATNGVQAQGAFSYTGDDGQVYSVTYTADEGGYQPKGDHLPTPPPIPEEILRSLEQNARDEAAGLVDDGSYDAKKYNEGSDYSESDNGQYKHGSSGQSNQGSFSSGNDFRKQSAGHGSQTFASATSGQGRVNFGNRNGQDSSPDSSNLNSFSQALTQNQGQSSAQSGASIHGQPSQNQNGLSRNGFNNRPSFDQANSKFGLQTGHGAQTSAFAGQGQSNNREAQSSSQATFGKINNKVTDKSSTTGASENQFTSQFSQNSRFGQHSSGNRQGQLNRYLPPLQNQGDRASFQQQSFSQDTFQGQAKPANQFNSNVQQDNKFASNNNLQSAQNENGASDQRSQTIGNAGEHSGSSAFGTASFGSQLTSGRISGLEGASNAVQGINGQLNGQSNGQLNGQQAASSTFGVQRNNERINGFGGVLNAQQKINSQSPSGPQSGSSAFGSASFGSQSNNAHFSSFGGASNVPELNNGQSSEGQQTGSSASFGAQSDIGRVSSLGASQGFRGPSANSHHASSSAFSAQSNNGRISGLGSELQTPQGINLQSSNGQQTGSTNAFGATQSSDERVSGFGTPLIQGQSSNKFNSGTTFSGQSGSQDTNAHGVNHFDASSLGNQPNSGGSRFGASSNTENRFGSAPESNENSAQASAQFNSGFLQQKQLTGSQFNSQQSSGKFGHQQQIGIGSYTQRPAFNQQATSAQINSGANNENSYHYNQPTRQFGAPTNGQQSRFQSTSQFNIRNSGSAQLGAPQQANRFALNTNGATNNAPFNARPQNSAHATAQFQSAQQSPGFQKQTSAIPQAFQPLRQPSAHSSASAQFGASQAGSNEPAVPTQQYDGEIYEYNKPEQTLPSEKDQDGSSSSQSTFSSAFVGNNPFAGSSVAGKGEVFGGPRKAPSFDSKTGYHY